LSRESDAVRGAEYGGSHPACTNTPLRSRAKMSVNTAQVAIAATRPRS
jgi:hypothetical protein